MARKTVAVVGHVGPGGVGGEMAAPHALAALAALGQSTRLEIFRLLMRAAPDGLAAGAVAEWMAAPQNTLSSHLAILARTGLVTATRQGRSIIYRANVQRMRALLDFLVHDCCSGHPELCGLGRALEEPGRSGPDCDCSATGKTDGCGE